MRSDHISAWLIKDWLIEEVPEVAARWPFEVGDDVKAVVKGMQKIIPTASVQSAAQNVTARNAIARWNLKDVVLLAGGTPTVLSPKAEDLRYFTDGNAEAVAEARQAGYPGIQVDVTKFEDLQKLAGSKTAIGTGLFHFLPDPLAQNMFENIANVGFETLIFTHANLDSGQEIVDAFAKQGIKVYIRSRDGVNALLARHWRIADMFPVSQLVFEDPEIGQYLSGLPSLFDFYRVTRI